MRGVRHPRKAVRWGKGARLGAAHVGAKRALPRQTMEAREAGLPQTKAPETGRPRPSGAASGLLGQSSGEKANDDAHDEATLRARWREIVQRQPVLAVTGALAVGAALGGVVFWRTGRLAFLVVAGYVANELWHSERRIEIDELIAKLSSPRRGAV